MLLGMMAFRNKRDARREYIPPPRGGLTDYTYYPTSWCNVRKIIPEGSVTHLSLNICNVLFIEDKSTRESLVSVPGDTKMRYNSEDG